jgi:hypothetical protein
MLAVGPADHVVSNATLHARYVTGAPNSTGPARAIPSDFCGKIPLAIAQSKMIRGRMLAQSGD